MRARSQLALEAAFDELLPPPLVLPPLLVLPPPVLLLPVLLLPLLLLDDGVEELLSLDEDVLEPLDEPESLDFESPGFDDA